MTYFSVMSHVSLSVSEIGVRLRISDMFSDPLKYLTVKLYGCNFKTKF